MPEQVGSFSKIGSRLWAFGPSKTSMTKDPEPKAESQIQETP